MHVAMFVTSALVHDSQVRKEAETEAGANHEVTVFSHIAPADIPRLGWQGKPNLCAVSVSPVDLRDKRGLARAWAAARNLWRWGGSHDLWAAAREHRGDVHHAPDLDTPPVTASLARRDRARQAYDSHELFMDQIDLGPGATPSTWRQRPKLRLFRQSFGRLERGLIGRADAIITVSQSIADELVTRYHIRTPTLILNAPRYRAPGRGTDYLRQRLGLSPNEQIILQLGGVIPGRGLLELVGSLTSLNENCKLVILGFNLGNYQAETRREDEGLCLFQVHNAGQADHHLLFWRFLNVGFWLRQFVDRRPSGENG
jgi:hypothetical protein